MRDRILITGTSGNVGSTVLQYLKHEAFDVTSGVRDVERARKADPATCHVHLDFERPETYGPALRGVRKVFLVRPPHLTDVKGIFEPFVQACRQAGVAHIVFLSLLGAEHNPFPPHHKIERVIKGSGMAYTFIRPGFFMQNLSTTHAEDIRERNDIFIPSGRAKVSFIDTRDIGEIIGKVLTEEGHEGMAYTVTGGEAVTYSQVSDRMTHHLGRRITYSNPSLLSFRKAMMDRGVKKEFATVMMVLYLTTSLGMASQVTGTSASILGRKPRSIDDFIVDHLDIWR
jgi:uncharacterized protein YbjT (DUF2867 family)